MVLVGPRDVLDSIVEISIFVDAMGLAGIESRRVEMQTSTRPDPPTVRLTKDVVEMGPL